MPKTRDKKFKESFDIFMTNACNNGNFLRLNYNLINQTRNKTSHIHKYVLEILGTFVSDENTGENVVDILPTTNNFMDLMKSYFEPYKLKRNNISMSYVKILSSGDNTPITSIHFKVVYHKEHLPFPIKLTELERCLVEIEALESDLEYEIRKRRSIAKLLKQERKSLVVAQENIKKLFLKNYRNDPCVNSCPVCWENIPIENAEIPICLHIICKTCYQKVSKCPLCRKPYVNHSITL